MQQVDDLTHYMNAVATLRAENKLLLDLNELLRQDNLRLVNIGGHVLDMLNEFHHDGCPITSAVQEWAQELDKEIALYDGAREDSD